MHLEALFNECLDFPSQRSVVVSNLITEEWNYDIGLMVPEQVLLSRQETKETSIEVVDATLE